MTNTKAPVAKNTKAPVAVGATPETLDMQPVSATPASRPNTPVVGMAEHERYELALANQGGYTLIPAKKVEKNNTIKAVEPRIERNGMVVCKRIAK